MPGTGKGINLCLQTKSFRCYKEGKEEDDNPMIDFIYIFTCENLMQSHLYKKG
jgi:hypothetical protein